MFCANLVIPPKTFDDLSREQAEFPRILKKKMAKMTLNVKDPYLQYQPRVSQDACFVQIWWFQHKSVTSYFADKVKFTDEHTCIDTGNDNTPSALKAKGLKMADIIQTCSNTFSVQLNKIYSIKI